MRNAQLCYSIKITLDPCGDPVKSWNEELIKNSCSFPTSPTLQIKDMSRKNMVKSHNTNVKIGLIAIKFHHF